MKTSETEYYQLVERIPAGKVLTYGAVADLCGNRWAAMAVGRAMGKRSSDVRFPWWRVTLRDGKLSPGAPSRQRELLESEGVTFHSDGRVDLRVDFWAGPHRDQR